MTLEEKIYWTLIFGGGLVISYIFLLIANHRLKNQLNITDSHWFFSKTKFKILRIFMLVGFIFLVIMMWTNKFIMQ
jgi:hypothetical protein